MPVVVYHGERAWSVPRSIESTLSIDEDARTTLGPLVPRFHYLVDDLTQLDAAALRRRGLPAFATVALWALRTAYDRSFVTAVEHLVDLFEQLRAAPDGPAALRTIISYLVYVSRPGEDLVGHVGERLSRGLREEVMDITQMLAEKKRAEGLQQGLEEGLERGRAEGRAEGRADLLLRLLRLRFGAIPMNDERRVREASIEDLDRWAERVLTAASIDELWA